VPLAFLRLRLMLLRLGLVCVFGMLALSTSGCRTRADAGNKSDWPAYAPDSSKLPIFVRPGQASVCIGGLAETPGRYPWREGMTLIDLVNLSGGRSTASGRMHLFFRKGQIRMQTPPLGHWLWARTLYPNDEVWIYPIRGY